MMSGAEYDNIPDHYQRYDCPNCESFVWTAPRCERSDIGVVCHDCGTTIAISESDEL